MSTPPISPIDWFLARVGTDMTWGQVHLRRLSTRPGFELRHAADATASPDTLRELRPAELRVWSDTDARGEFRPLKSVPDLRPGWRCEVKGPKELEWALDDLLPGSVADAWAWEHGSAALPFEDLAARQVGRAGVLRDLPAATLALAVAVACRPGSCVKRRVWTGTGVPAEGAGEARTIPCLEACPLVQSLARTCAGIEAKASVPGHFAPDDLATLAAALRHAQEHRPEGLRFGDLAAPLHPWRIARLLARHADLWSQAELSTQESDE